MGAEPIEGPQPGGWVPFGGSGCIAVCPRSWVPLDSSGCIAVSPGGWYLIMVIRWKGAGRPRVERWTSRLRRCGPG